MTASKVLTTVYAINVDGGFAACQDMLSTVAQVYWLPRKACSRLRALQFSVIHHLLLVSTHVHAMHMDPGYLLSVLGLVMMMRPAFAVSLTAGADKPVAAQT